MDIVLLAAFFAVVAISLWITERRLGRGGETTTDPPARSDAYEPAALRSGIRTTARGLVRSPWIWLGIAASLATLVEEGRPAYPGALIVGVLFPVVLGTFAATYVVVARDRSADDRQRDARAFTVGQLIVAWGAASVLGLAATAAVYLVIVRGDLFGPLRFHPLELIQPLTALLVVTSLAVGAARWWRHPLGAIPVGVIVFFPPFGWLLDLYLITGRTAPEATAVLAAGPPTSQLVWHMLFLLGFALLGVGIGLLRHDRRPSVVALPAVAAAMMIAGYVLRTA